VIFSVCMKSEFILQASDFTTACSGDFSNLFWFLPQEIEKKIYYKNERNDRKFD
jgi:hypothetical protein